MKERSLDLLIIEDDPLHLQHLQQLLSANYPNFQLLPPCTTGNQALIYLKDHTPHIVFFDIDLGDLNAFDVLKQLKNHHFEIIFTTAYNEYALSAFRVHAADFLLKPIIDSELIETINRVINRPPLTNQSEENIIDKVEKLTHQFLIINEKQRVKYIPITDLIYLEADRNYTHIYYREKDQQMKTTATGCLTSFEKLLENHDVKRIHDKYIVRTSEIREFDKGNIKVRLANGVTLPVSRQKRSFFNI